MIGLFTGTVVLVVFVRGIIATIKRFGWGPDAENRVLIAIILAFAALSFMLTRSVVRRVYRVGSPRTRRLALGALLVPGLFSMWAWSDPTRMLAGVAGGESTRMRMAGGPEFVFGPYPHEDRLKELKAAGFTAVISLQHPNVVVEINGIQREKEATARLGLPLIQTPMLPWVSGNEAALERIREIARTGEGKYYVHCGLGRDRVNVVKRVIASLADSSRQNLRVAESSDLQVEQRFEDRTAPFQRGRLYRLAADVWLAPVPNEAELAYTIYGAPGRVLLALDPSDPAQRAFIQSAEKEFRTYSIPHAVIPFTVADAAVPARLDALVKRVRSEPGRVTIIVPRTPFASSASDSATAAARGLLRGYGVSW